MEALLFSVSTKLKVLPWHRSKNSAMAVSLGKRTLRAGFFTLPPAQALNGESHKWSLLSHLSCLMYALSLRHILYKG